MMQRIHFTLNVAIFTLMALLVTGCDDGDSSHGYYPSPVNGSSSSGSGSTSSSSTSSTSSSSSTSSGGDSEKDDSFAVENHYPASKARNVSLVTTVDVALGAGVMMESVPEDFISLTSPAGLVEGYLIELDDRQFRFTPYDPLTPNTRYQVSTAPIMSTEGLENEGYQWEFTTADNIGATPQEIIDSCMNQRDITMLAAVNQARLKARKCGSVTYSAAAPLKWNCKLRLAAQAHSDEMATSNFFSHIGSDGSRPSDRVQAQGYRYSTVRENIAAGQTSIEEVMRGLLNSPEHCETIMANTVEEFGFGYTENTDSDMRRYWTQVYGSPR